MPRANSDCSKQPRKRSSVARSGRVRETLGDVHSSGNVPALTRWVQCGRERWEQRQCPVHLLAPGSGQLAGPPKMFAPHAKASTTHPSWPAPISVTEAPAIGGPRSGVPRGCCVGRHVLTRRPLVRFLPPHTAQAGEPTAPTPPPAVGPNGFDRTGDDRTERIRGASRCELREWERTARRARSLGTK